MSFDYETAHDAHDEYAERVARESLDDFEDWCQLEDRPPVTRRVVRDHLSRLALGAAFDGRAE